MGQTQKVGKVGTTVRTSDGKTVVKYHKTDVVKFDERRIILNSGGWRTVTTKTRMNQASAQFGLGYGVFQEKGLWYVENKGEVLDFFDNMTLGRQGGK